MTSNRMMWEVTPYAFALGLLGWKVSSKENGKYNLRRSFGTFPNKDDAVAFAVSQCHFYWRQLQIPCELKIKNKWGRIQDSRTYGMDPENIHG